MPARSDPTDRAIVQCTVAVVTRKHQSRTEAGDPMPSLIQNSAAMLSPAGPSARLCAWTP